MEKSCGNCEHSAPSDIVVTVTHHIRTEGGNQETAEKQLWCRLRPPVPIITSRTISDNLEIQTHFEYPRVNESWTCGKHKPR